MVSHRTLCCCGVPLHARCIVIGVLDLNIFATLLVFDSRSFDFVHWAFWLNLFSLTVLIGSGLLIYGGIARKQSFLWPWVIFNFVLIVLLVIVLFVCAAAWQEEPVSDAMKAYFEFTKVPYGLQNFVISFIAIISIVLIILQIYFIIVVTDYIYELGDVRSRRYKCKTSVQHDTYIV